MSLARAINDWFDDLHGRKKYRRYHGREERKGRLTSQAFAILGAIAAGGWGVAMLATRSREPEVQQYGLRHGMTWLAMGHWPVILLPHQYLSGVPVVPWSVFVLSDAIIFTWIFTNTGGSVLMCALYHGCTNLGMILYGGIDPALAPWFKGSTSVLVALGVVAWAGPGLTRAQGPMRGSRPTRG